MVELHSFDRLSDVSPNSPVAFVCGHSASSRLGVGVPRAMKWGIQCF